VLFYSYSTQWFARHPGGGHALRVVVNGLAFGVITVVLMIARIQVGEAVFMDGRHVPLALITLFEAWPTGLVAAAPAVAYRLAQGGAGAWPGVLGLLVTVLLGGLAHAWAARAGGVRLRHALVLSVSVFVATAATFPLAGPHATGLLGRFWVQMLLTSVLGIGIIARLFEDVVEQARLAAERLRFRAVLDEASDAIRILDADTLVILDCNRRDAEICGYAREEMIGRHAREFFPDDQAQRARREATIAEARARGTARAFGEPFRVRSGAIVRVDATRRLVEHAGRRYEIVIYRESADREAREVAERESVQLKAVTLLASGAAHEINNPLAVVMGSLDLLARALPPGAQEGRWVEQALAGVGRIRDIVLRMHNITRLEATPPEGRLPSILDISKSAVIPRKERS
jgi:PAS domain S-box-containing protein